MFQPGFFVSPFWDWFITIVCLASILACYLLVIWQSGGHRPSGDEVKTMGHVWDENLEELNNPLPMWWLNMFYITMVFGLVYFALYPGLGSYAGILKESQLVEYAKEVDDANARFAPMFEQYRAVPIAELAKNPAAVETGKRLYLTYCNVCHGSDGKGAKGFPNLTDNDWLWGGTPEAIEISIMKGRNAAMPNAKTNRLNSEADINNMANYVLSLSGQKVDDAAAAAGQKLYAAVCIACHNPKGTGTQAMGAPNLTDNIWLYGGSLEAIKQTLTNGRQGRMPAHGEFLGAAKGHLLATYVYSLSQNDVTKLQPSN